MSRILAGLGLLFCTAAAQEILFTDDFSDGNADGWYELGTGAQYEVIDYRYCISAGSGIEHGSTFCADGPSGMSTVNYSVFVEFTTHSPTHGVLVYARADYDFETGYFLYLRTYQDQVRICRQDVDTWTELADTAFTFEYDQFYWARFMCCGDSFFGKVRQGELADEPLDWLLQASDTTYSDAGYFGLGAVNAGAMSGIDAEFDNVLVTGQQLVLDPVTWTAIKATFRY